MKRTLSSFTVAACLLLTASLSDSFAQKKPAAPKLKPATSPKPKPPATTKPADALARRVLHGYSQKRSGDVVVIQEPFKYISSGGVGATHGAPYAYDTHVPLIIMGGGVAPGRYLQAATPADIAPTLARLLGVEPPSNATGRVLGEAIK